MLTYLTSTADECYPDSTECLSTLFRPNAELIAPFVINSEKQSPLVIDSGTMVKPRQYENGFYLSLTVPETVLAAGKFFYLQGLVWVAAKHESDPNARLLARLATRITLRRPVVTTTTTRKIVVEKDDHHTMPITSTQKTQSVSKQAQKHTNAGYSWPHNSFGAVAVFVLLMTYC